MQWADLQGDAWLLREEKTGVVRHVPLPAPALAIIHKQDGESHPVPRLSAQKMNQYIKDVARRAKLTTPVTLRSQKGGKVVSRTVPKWEALTSHSGRKTFVSLLLEAGLSTKDLMGITHNDLRALRQYTDPSDDHLRLALTDVFERVN